MFAGAMSHVGYNFPIKLPKLDSEAYNRRNRLIYV